MIKYCFGESIKENKYFGDKRYFILSEDLNKILNDLELYKKIMFCEFDDIYKINIDKMLYNYSVKHEIVRLTEFLMEYTFKITGINLRESIIDIEIVCKP